MAAVCSILVLSVALILPIALVWRFERLGVFLGTLTAWGSLMLAGWLLAQFDPQGDEGDNIWILFGWLPSLVYCYIIEITLGFKELHYLQPRRKALPEPLNEAAASRESRPPTE